MYATLAAVVAAAVLVPAPAPVPGGVAAPPPPAPRPAAPAVDHARVVARTATPRLRWKRCEGDYRFQCASARVPLDYTAPRGPRIEIQLTRSVAKAKGKARLGSLFINPGGPGLSAIEALPSFIRVLGPAVTDRFDIVAMDPRGVEQSSPLWCWSPQAGPTAELGIYPTDRAQAAKRIADDTFVRGMCAKTGKPLMDHMSTGDVARDLELMRRAVGDKGLSFYGVSYGSALGATYANMFPATSRAVLVDGILDPVAWTTGWGADARTIPNSSRSDAGAGAEETLRSAFLQCRRVGPNRCPHSRTITAEWEALVARLRRGPVRDKNGGVRTLDSETQAVLHALYHADGYRDLMRMIHDSHEAVVKGRRPSSAGERLRKAAAQNPAPLGATGGPEDGKRSERMFQAGVVCADGVNPADPWAWWRYASSPRVASSWFGPLWAWNSSVCAGWPSKAPGAYRGPFNVKPANGMLVVGNTHDPATPLSQARRLASYSPGARLLTVDTWGHTAADSSACASAHMRRYLLTGALPRAGVVCRANRPLFG